jgi:hypothetical protein
MKTYEDRVAELEQEGLTTSDAQAVADVEVKKGKVGRAYDQRVAHEILCCYSDSPKANDIMDYTVLGVKRFYEMTEDVVPAKERAEYKGHLAEYFGAF